MGIQVVTEMAEEMGIKTGNVKLPDIAKVGGFFGFEIDKSNEIAPKAP